ncbi:MAG: ECF-type sigma factor [Planctomycetota bacterium]
MPPNDLTLILNAIDAGDPRAPESLLPLVYEELRTLAEARLAQDRAGQTLEATALVHEAYLRLIGPGEHDGATTGALDISGNGRNGWSGRAHFFGAAAHAMRRILVDRARARGAAKRGGSWKRLDVDLAATPIDELPAELVDLDAALARFAELEPEKARLVELRFFAGLSMEQAAAILEISPATAGRYWTYARAWLFRALKASNEATGPSEKFQID